MKNVNLSKEQSDSYLRATLPPFISYLWACCFDVFIGWSAEDVAQEHV